MAKRKANRGEDDGGGRNIKKTKVSHVVHVVEWCLTSSLTDDSPRNTTKKQVSLFPWSQPADTFPEFEVDYVASG